MLKIHLVFIAIFSFIGSLPKGNILAEDWTLVHIGKSYEHSYSISKDTIKLFGGGHYTTQGDYVTLLCKQIDGDFTISTCVRSLVSLNSTPVTDWTGAGIFVRESLTTKSSFIALPIYKVGLYQEDRKPGQNFMWDDNTAHPKMPLYIKVSRQIDTFITSYSADGVNYTPFKKVFLPIKRNAFVGLQITTHGESAKQAIFTETKIVVNSTKAITLKSPDKEISSGQDQAKFNFHKKSQGSKQVMLSGRSSSLPKGKEYPPNSQGTLFKILSPLQSLDE